MSRTAPRRLFILAIGDARRASSRLRIWDHVDWLKGAGYTVNVDYATASEHQHVNWRVVGRWLARLPQWVYWFLRADAILIQETLLLAPLLWLKTVGKRRRLVFDFSDPIDLHGSGLSGRVRAASFGRMMQAADHVIVENEAYLEQLKSRGGSTSQFYGPVDTERYARAREAARADTTDEAPVRIGWTGSPGTLALIEPLFPILDRLAQTHRISLCLMGLTERPAGFERLPVTIERWTEAREFEVVPTFDLGLFMLDRSKRSQRRGGGKLFVYMAAGVPFIASDHGISADLMRSSRVGFAVARVEDWSSALAQAVEGAQRRRQYSVAGMAYANEHLSYREFRRLLQAKLGEARD